MPVSESIKPEYIKIPSESPSVIVQLYIDGNPVLRALDRRLFSHGDVLRNTLDEFGITYEEIDSRLGQKIPAKEDREGKRYKLVGAGQCLIVEKNLMFAPDLDDYGMELNEEHLQQCEPAFKEKGFRWERLK